MLEIIDIVNKLPSSGSNGYRTLRSIRGLVIHHDAVSSDMPYGSLRRYESQARYHVRKGWTRHAYSYRIDNVGDIFLVNPLQEITWHSGHFPTNISHIAVCLDGNFTKHKPSDAQLMSLKNLFVHLTMERPEMPHLIGSSVRTHREVRPRPTSCPGQPIQEFVDALRNKSCNPLL